MEQGLVLEPDLDAWIDLYKGSFKSIKVSLVHGNSQIEGAANRNGLNVAALTTTIDPKALMLRTLNFNLVEVHRVAIGPLTAHADDRRLLFSFGG